MTRAETPETRTRRLPRIVLAVPEELPGISLASGAPPVDRVIASEYYRPLVHLGLLQHYFPEGDRVSCLADRRVAAVRSGDAKLILDSRGDALFFDLAADPAEKKNLAKERKDRKKELEDVIATFSQKK